MKLLSQTAIVVAVLAGLTGAPAARQDATVTGEVIEVGVSGLAGVAVTFVGPMEGQAERALKSFPLMAEEIADRLGIPQIRTVTDAEGRFKFAVSTPGLYALVFRRQGYIGAAKPGDPLSSVLVTATVTVVDGTPSPPIIVEMIRRG